MGKIITGAAAVLALVTGGITVYDRFFPQPKMEIDIGGGEDVVTFTDFLRQHDGEKVELHVNCLRPEDSWCGFASYDDQPRTTDGQPDPNETLAYLFREQPCTDEYGRGGDCPGAWWLYIQTSDNTTDALTQPTGAGSFALDGLFNVRVGVAGFFLPPDVTGANLRAIEK